MISLRSLAMSVLWIWLAVGPLGAQEVEAGHMASRPRVEMARVDEPITLDGRLDEGVWQWAKAATDFTQQDPEEGKPATQRTEVRFAMDASALYVGARMYDALGAEGVRTRLARRDQISGGDGLMLEFDTFHDHAGRTRFRINPSGVKFDAGQAAPYADPSWDPVWEAATGVDSLGWTAELRIPLSQLRFPRDSMQVWGLQIWRYVERLNEESMWSFWGKTESGGPAHFGHLTGIEITGRSRAMEILPYTTMRASYVAPTQPGSPFQSGSAYTMRVGADVKALLTSTLTLDATLNPDFGQVEVDPAIVNLSAFETFLPERRPFFVEGSGLFGFGGLNCYFCSNVSGMSLFYSRRIGRRPQGYVTFPTRYTDVPENTGILGAAKITGRTAGGLQVGLLNAVTSSEQARLITADGAELDREVEPLSNYMVGRVKRTSRDGDLTIGAMGTSVIRSFGYDSLALILPAHAEAVGFDWSSRWREQAYSFAGNVALSQVAGDPAAILRLQNSSARYFNRPDRQHGSNGLFSDRYDPSLEALRGIGGYARLAKESGDVLWETAVNFRSPGFEVNDLAFLHRADYLWMNGNVLRRWTEPTRYYREFAVLGGAQQQYNFDGDLINREYRVYTGGQAPNYWNWNSFVIVRPETYDDRLTRGGPVVQRPRSWFAQTNLSTDSRKRLGLGTSPGYGIDGDGAYSVQLNLDVNLKPASNVSMSLGPQAGRNATATQFVRSFADSTAIHFHGQRTVFAELVQHSVSMNTRLAVTFTPALTLELFAQPLIASGEYTAFKEYVGTRTTRTATYDDAQLRPVRSLEGRVTSYVLNPHRDPAAGSFAFDNPDFNLRSLRGNAILRWEYRPGSTLYLVWQQNRSGTEPFGDLEFSRDASGVFQQRPDNVFVLKMSHWFGS
jgi:hypothetical protein